MSKMEKRPMSEWRPIETAPKDGTGFLGFYPEKRGFVARQDVLPTHWCGWGGGVWETCHGEKPIHGPTHWMPFPEPPAH